MRSLPCKIKGIILSVAVCMTSACGGSGGATATGPTVPSAALSTLAVAPSTVLADGVACAEVSVAVKDSAGNPMMGVTVTFTATGSANTFNPSTASSGANGVATASLTSTRPEAKTVSAVAGGVALAQTQTAQFTAAVGSISFATQPSQVTAGESLGPVQVAAMSPGGAPTQFVETVVVSLAVAPTGAELAGTTTALPGNLTASFSGLSLQKAGSYVLRVSSSGVYADSLAFSVGAGAPNATTSTLAAQPPSVPSDGTWIDLVATLRDRYGNSGPGTVTFAASGTATFVQPSSPAGADGVVTGRVSSFTPGSQSVRAVVAGNVVASTTVSFTGTPLSVSRSTVAVTPALLPADGITAATVTVDVRNADGLGVNGQIVSLAFSGSGTVSPALATTDAAGKATFNVVSTVVTEGSLVATVNPGPSQLVLTSSPSLKFTENARWEFVGAGRGFTVAIMEDGTLWQWGNYSAGPSVRRQVGTDNRWVSADVGADNKAAVKSDGTLWGWGSNSRGQVGDGTYETRIFPVQLGVDTNWAWPVVGDGHSLSVKTDGSIWGWGGFVCDGVGGPRNAPVVFESGVASAAVGDSFTHVVKTDGSLWACGINGVGQLGVGAGLGPFSSLVHVGVDRDWKSVAAGANHAVAVKTNGTLWGWGVNASGQVGDGTTANRFTPVQIGVDTDWESVSAIVTSSLGRRKDGTLWAWGANIGSTGNSLQPVQVGTDSDWASVTGGRYHVTAIKADKSLWTWGANLYGELGDGTQQQTSVPQRVP